MNMIKLPIEKDELIHLLPHKGKMFLIERITACDINEWNVTSETIVRDTCLFYDKSIDGIPNYVCFELMAQTISALTGIIIREKNLPVNMGFILSVSAIKFSYMAPLKPPRFPCSISLLVDPPSIVTRRPISVI